MRNRTLARVATFALAAMLAGCGGSRQLRAARTQRYIGSVPLGADTADVTRELGSAARKAAYDIGGRSIELLFYRTSASSCGIGIVCASKYTPLIFEAGKLIAVGWETERPEFTREAAEELLALVSAGKPPVQMLKKDLNTDTKKQQAP